MFPSLTVNGSTLLDPAGKTIRLTGFNWQLGRTAPNEGDVMRQVMPGVRFFIVFFASFEYNFLSLRHP